MVTWMCLFIYMYERAYWSFRHQRCHAHSRSSSLPFFLGKPMRTQHWFQKKQRGAQEKNCAVVTSKAGSVEKEEIAADSLCINLHWCFISFLSSVHCAMKVMTSLVWSLKLSFPYPTSYTPTDHLPAISEQSSPENDFEYSIRRKYRKDSL